MEAAPKNGSGGYQIKSNMQSSVITITAFSNELDFIQSLHAYPPYCV
jgi:hypothetical protein